MVDALLRFLPMAEKVIPKRTTIGILENICIKDGIMRATNLEMEIAMPIDSDASCVIPLSILKSIIKSRPREINVEQASDSRLRILYDDRNVEFASHCIDDYPFPDESGFIEVGTWRKGVIDVLNSMTNFCSNDLQRPSLCGVDVLLNGSMTTSATDGHVLKKVVLHGDYAPMHAIIPKRLLQILPLMVNRHASISRSDELIKLVTDSDFRIIARPIDIAFPDINRVMPKTFTHIASMNRDELLRLFLEAASFADNETRRVILRFGESKLVVSVENKERCIEWEGTMPHGGTMPNDYAVGINIDYGIKVLKDITAHDVLWKFNDPASAIIVHGADVENEIFLLMPIRLK